MQRHEALAIAEQLLAEPQFGQYRDRYGHMAVWTESELGHVSISSGASRALTDLSPTVHWTAPWMG